MNLTTLAHYLDGEVNARQHVDGAEQAFTEVMLTHLSNSDEIDGYNLDFAQRTGRKNAPAYKFNAWNLHEQTGDEEGVAPLVDLFVTLCKPEATGEVVSKAEVAKHFELARNFLSQALAENSDWLSQLEESAPAYVAGAKIRKHRRNLDTARIFLLTNGVVKVAEERDVEISGIDVKHYLWDLEKLSRLLSSGQERETIEIDLLNSYGGAVHCLAQEDGIGEYTAYLAFFPATLLAKIYGDYGYRLLEKNVRSFLQAKGKVNKGIQQTIRETPHRFLAYNNGISGTAETVVVSRSKDGLCKLEMLRDFQIVNGGQTTASIYHAVKRERVDITNVTVQVKLTVVNDSAKVAEFVPKIARYANSQNKVNTADFSANDEWHQELEKHSRKIWAPAASGTGKQTRWFYERARGSHLDGKLQAGPPAKQKEWELKNPISQKFTKTDVAKYDNAWNQLPHIVCKGAEKNFIAWTIRRLDAKRPLPTETDFEDLCAKAIFFRTAEKLIGKLELGGYRANVVAYTLAWLARSTNERIDLKKIWQHQALGKALQDAITIVGRVAHSHLLSYAGTKNVTGESQKPDCWERFRDKKIELPTLTAELQNVGSSKTETLEIRSSVASRSSQELQDDIARVSPDTWAALCQWGENEQRLKPFQITLATTISRKIQKGAKVRRDEIEAILDILNCARKNGFQGEI